MCLHFGQSIMVWLSKSSDFRQRLKMGRNGMDFGQKLSSEIGTISANFLRPERSKLERAKI